MTVSYWKRSVLLPSSPSPQDPDVRDSQPEAPRGLSQLGAVDEDPEETVAQGAEPDALLVREGRALGVRLLPEVVDGRLELVAGDRLTADVCDSRVRMAAAAQQQAGDDSARGKHCDHGEAGPGHGPSGKRLCSCQRPASSSA